MHMATVMEDIQALEARHVLQTYRRQPITLVRGEGVRLWDADGREYLDLLSGIGVASLGHANPGLAHLSGLPRAFFCNSGTEAVEACLKFARRYWHTLGETRTEIIALENSF